MKARDGGRDGTGSTTSGLAIQPPDPPIPTLHSLPCPSPEPSSISRSMARFHSQRWLRFRGSADKVSKLGRKLGLWQLPGLAGLQLKLRLEPPPASIIGQSITGSGLLPGQDQCPGGQCRGWPQCQWIDRQGEVTEVRERPGAGALK